MNIRDFPYRGKIITTGINNLEGKITKPGSSAGISFCEAGLYRYAKNTWVIEHAYGFTITGLPIMFLGAITTTDIISVICLTYNYFKEVIKSFIV